MLNELVHLRTWPAARPRQAGLPRACYLITAQSVPCQRSTQGRLAPRGRHAQEPLAGAHLALPRNGRV
jgi:hypothetical protein